VVGVFCEPVPFAVRADGFLTDLTLEWVLQNVIAHTAYQLWQERSHVRLVIDVVLFIDVGCAG
jgi:hypothetical protein